MTRVRGSVSKYNAMLRLNCIIGYLIKAKVGMLRNVQYGVGEGAEGESNICCAAWLGEGFNIASPTTDKMRFFTTEI